MRSDGQSCVSRQFFFVKAAERPSIQKLGSHLFKFVKVQQNIKIPGCATDYVLIEHNDKTNTFVAFDKG